MRPGGADSGLAMAGISDGGALDHAEALARTLGLTPLPGEGGYFRRTWTSDAVLPGGRPAGSAILFLETSAPDGFSAFHELDAEEVYHFHAGDPVELYALAPDGELSLTVLGPDPLSGQSPQAVVPAGFIQGSRLAPGGAWALLGTTMAPAYEESGFRLVAREELLARLPGQAGLVESLTRG